MLGVGYSSLPLAIAISGVCLEAQRRRLGLWFGPDSKQTSKQLGGLQHRGLFEKPVPSGCTLEAHEHSEISKPRGGAHRPPGVPVLVPPHPEPTGDLKRKNHRAQNGTVPTFPDLCFPHLCLLHISVQLRR